MLERCVELSHPLPIQTNNKNNNGFMILPRCCNIQNIGNQGLSNWFSLRICGKDTLDQKLFGNLAHSSFTIKTLSGIVRSGSIETDSLK